MCVCGVEMEIFLFCIAQKKNASLGVQIWNLNSNNLKEVLIFL